MKSIKPSKEILQSMVEGVIELYENLITVKKEVDVPMLLFMHNLSYEQFKDALTDSDYAEQDFITEVTKLNELRKHFGLTEGE